MGQYQDVQHESRKRREFGRLVAAWGAANRHNLHITAALFSERLQRMGGYLNEYGVWQLYTDDPGSDIQIVPPVRLGGL